MLWTSLWVSLPHDLKVKAVVVAKQIWLFVGEVCAVDLDPKRNKIELVRKNPPSGSASLQAWLILYESNTGQPNQAEYLVDIINKHVKCKKSGLSVELPPGCIPYVNEIAAWVRTSSRQTTQATTAENGDGAKETREELSQQQEKTRKRPLHTNDPIGDYEDRLRDALQAQPGKRKRSIMTRYNRGECPVCRRTLKKCFSCTLVSCSGSNCFRATFDGLRACTAHPEKFFCAACREEERSSKPWHARSLEKCPSCHRYYCTSELIWCSGEVQNNQPRHSPKILDCSACCKGSRTTIKTCLRTACSHKRSKENRCIQLKTCGECAEFGTYCSLAKEPGHLPEWVCSYCAGWMTKKQCEACSQDVCDLAVLRSCELCGKPENCGNTECSGEYLEEPECGCEPTCESCTPEIECCDSCNGKKGIYCEHCKASGKCESCGDISGCSNCIDTKDRCPNCKMSLVRPHPFYSGDSGDEDAMGVEGDPFFDKAWPHHVSDDGSDQDQRSSNPWWHDHQPVVRHGEPNPGVDRARYMKYHRLWM